MERCGFNWKSEIQNIIGSADDLLKYKSNLTPIPPLTLQRLKVQNVWLVTLRCYGFETEQMKLLELSRGSKGAHSTVPHSWRRHCTVQFRGKPMYSSQCLIAGGATALSSLEVNQCILHSAS